MGLRSVGVAGFEPATLWSQTRCANRAALHPVLHSEALAKECCYLHSLGEEGLIILTIATVHLKQRKSITIFLIS
jgi:hypothetical protein